MFLKQRDGCEAPGYDEFYTFTSPPPRLGERLEGNFIRGTVCPGSRAVVPLVDYHDFTIGDRGSAQILEPLFWS